MNIWETLSKIDCNAHVEKKGRFSYLSWTWAWAMVKERYPLAQYAIEPDITYPDSTMEVRCTVTIEELSHTMWLPVINANNKAIANPNAFDVNSSRMRCLVKCLAMFGLGHYIYAGESLPVEGDYATFTDIQKEEFHGFITANDDPLGFLCFTKTVGDDVFTALQGTFPAGQIVSGKKIANSLITQGFEILHNTVAQISEHIANRDTDGLLEIIEAYHTPVQRKLLGGLLNAEQLKALREVKELAA